MTTDQLLDFMSLIGTVTMDFWAIALMFVIVMVILLISMPSLFFRCVIFCILCFWSACVYLVLDIR
jgi:hypothetical protein